ncbi:hypothetical protein KCU81_g35, partial [Aureobasidium melanogenum]
MLSLSTALRRSVRQLPLRLHTDPTQRDRSRSRRRSRSPRRSRRSYDSRSRSRSRDNYRRDERRSRSPVNGSAAAPNYAANNNAYPSDREGGASAAAPPRNFEERVVAKEQMMQNVREHSQQDRRVYVGNLSYDVKWHHLKDFMRQAGEVIFADVLLLPNGMSKGCGIVEYATRDQAQNAVNTLSNQNLMGRLVYVREDREAEPRFSSGGQGGGMRGGFQGGMRGGFGGGYDAMGGGSGMMGGSRQIYVSNVCIAFLISRTSSVKLLTLALSSVSSPSTTLTTLRSPFSSSTDMTGTVAFLKSEKTASLARPASVAAVVASWADVEVSVDSLVVVVALWAVAALVDNSVVVEGLAAVSVVRLLAGSTVVPLLLPLLLTPSPILQPPVASLDLSSTSLPWSTSNEDLVELFTTIGKVERAEIQYEPNGRSRGTGVVEFGSAEDAGTAITSQPSSLDTNMPAVDPMQGQEQTGGMPMGLTQDQIIALYAPAGASDE